MNTLIYGMHWKSQSEAVNNLQKSGLIDVKIWIGKNRDNEINIGKLRRTRIEKEPYSGLNSDIYDDVFKESFAIFLDMFARTPSMYTVTHQESINIYNYYYDYFSKILHDNKIQLLVFYNLPHFGSDYLLTVIAKHMQIKMVLMHQSLIPNRFQYITSLDDFGDFDTSKVEFDYPIQQIKKEFHKSLFYMKNIKLKYKSCHYLFFKRVRQFVFRSVGRMTFLGLIQSYYDCLKFKSSYNKLAKHSFEVTKKSVYFPLQFQPELTTSTLGGIYTDQLLAIEKISNLIDDDWVILVKENPKQLEAHRGEFFFKRLALLKKVRYIAKEVNSHDLINSCQFVATITGTAGWEAISGGKNVVIFGKSWYQKFPGVFKYSKDLKLDDILNYKIDHDKLETAYNSFIKKTANGIVDRGYIANYPNYTDSQNSKHLQDSLFKIISALI